MAIFYFAAGFMGNLFAGCVESELSAGNNPAVMAISGGLASMVIINWKHLEGAGMLRICLMFMTVILFIFMLILGI